MIGIEMEKNCSLFVSTGRQSTPMSATDEFCNLDLLRSEKRSFSAYLRYVVTRLENDLDVKNEARELLKIESPELFLDTLMSPKFFLQLIQVIQADFKQPRCIKPTENGLMTAAISIGSAIGMRTPSGPLTLHARLKWAWQLIRLDLQQEMSEKRHPDLTAVFERMRISVDSRSKLDYRKVLLLWVAYHLKSRDLEPRDFKSSFRDGRLYVLLLSEILPTSLGIKVEVESLLASSAEERASRIEEIARMIGLGAFICAADVLAGHDRVNLIFVSQLLRLFPTIDTFTVLITRGIQNDYCGIGHRSPVHVGTDEAFRLFGTRETASFSPLEALVRWARIQPEASFALIHIRDVHSLEDEDAREHLIKFGDHCLENTKGVQLVSNLLENEANLASNEHLVDVKHGISDTCDTGFEQLLASIKERARGFSIRVGVIGVSTDFQINNLLFELQTRYNIKNLATCSALTAARTRRLHFNGLDNIERLLNVSVFHSVSDFTFWLAPNKNTVHLTCCTEEEAGKCVNSSNEICRPSLSSASSSSDLESLASHRSSPYPSRATHNGASAGPGSPTARSFSILERIEFDEKHLFGMEDLLIIDNLFRASSRIVVVRKLTGGFSGAMVLLAKSFDAEGHEQGPFVLKLGQIDAIAQERTNFERIEEIIGNQAPYVFASYEGMKRAGLKFAFASHCGQVLSTMTFKQAYSDANTSQEAIETILERVTSALNRFYTVARMRPWDLLASYDFDGRGWALAAGGSDEPTALALRISGLLLIETSEVVSLERLTFGSLPNEKHTYFNVWKLMNDLTRLRKWSLTQPFLVSFVHGDLNFSNILIDGSVNVWLIDFQYTMKAHYLKDLAKLENDAQMEVSLASHEEFDQALRFTALLHKHSPYDGPAELARESKELMSNLPTKLHRVCHTVLAIRSIIRDVNMGRETDPRAYHVTMLRYALHSMCFHQLSSWNRKWALANACSHAEHIVNLLKSDESTTTDTTEQTSESESMSGEATNASNGADAQLDEIRKTRELDPARDEQAYQPSTSES